MLSYNEYENNREGEHPKTDEKHNIVLRCGEQSNVTHDVSKTEECTPRSTALATARAADEINVPISVEALA